MLREQLLLRMELRRLGHLLVHETRTHLEELPLEVLRALLLVCATVRGGGGVPRLGLGAEDVGRLHLLHGLLGLGHMRLDILVVEEPLSERVIDLVAVC